MVHVPPVRGPLGAAVTQRLLVVARGIERLLGSCAAWDERVVSDLLALRAVAQHAPHPCTPGELRHALLFRKQSASGAMDRLERRGLARRIDVEDQRRRAFDLTARGRASLADVDQCMTTTGDALLAPLESDERGELDWLLDRIELAVREELFELEVAALTGPGPLRRGQRGS